MLVPICASQFCHSDVYYRGVRSNFGLVQQIELVAKGNLAAHTGGIWGHGLQGNF